MPEFDGPWGQLEPDPKPPPPRRRNVARLLIWLAVAAGIGGGIWSLARAFPGEDQQDWFRVGSLLVLLAAATARIFTSGPINWSQTARHAAVWIGVVLATALGFTYRADLLAAAARVRGELAPAVGQKGGAREVVVTLGESGFQVMGEVNGQPMRFVVDTGATDTVLSPDDAHRAGLDRAGLTFDHLAETANGTGRGARATAHDLSVGDIRFTQVPVVINQAPMTSSLLGMSFLRWLKSFEIRDGRLYLKGPA